MSPQSFSSQQLTIAWAARVSLPQLGARLTAFVETRASITTFRLAVQKASSTAFRNLPEELVSMIAKNVRDMVFEQRMKSWIKIDKCLTNDCSTLSHVESQEIVEMNEAYDGSLSKGELEEALGDEAAETHMWTVERWFEMLTSLDGASEIAKCVRVFAQDFGVRAYFMLRRTGISYTLRGDVIDAKAYLIVPLTQAPIFSTPEDEAATFTVDSELDHSLIAGAMDNQRQRVQTTAAMLGLHPYDADEDESLYEETVQIPKPTPCLCSRCDHWAQDEDSEILESSEGDAYCTRASEAHVDSITTERKPAEAPLVSTQMHNAPKRKPPSAKEFQPKLMILGCGKLDW